MSISQEARLALLGWSFRGAGVSVRERVAFTADEVREALTSLLQRGVISEGVIVSTCHRSEIYSFAVGRELAGRPDALSVGVAGPGAGGARGLLLLPRRGRRGAPPLPRRLGARLARARGERGPRPGAAGPEPRPGIRLHPGRDAPPLRERGRRRQARPRRRRRSPGTRSPSPRSGSSSRRRSSATSPQRQVLVIGAGETGSLFARHAVEAGVHGPVIVNRTASRAQELASSVNGRRRRLGESRAGGPPGRRRRQRDVEPRASGHAARRSRRRCGIGAAGPCSFSISPSRATSRRTSPRSTTSSPTRSTTWRRSPNENRARRAREVPVAEKIVEEELEKYLVWLGNLSVVPTVTQWRRRMEALRDLELERAPAAERERLRRLAGCFLRAGSSTSR